MNQYKVSELTDQIKSLIEGKFAGLIMVHGEVTEFSRASSGHIYLSLKDELSKLKAVYFRQYIRSDSFIPKNGDKISAIGELRLYAPDGTYQLMVRKVIYNTEGEFWKKFEETKKKLLAEGLFDEQNKKAVPYFPKRVALLTASTGAAVQDFIITAKNAGNFFNIDLWPIPVQGNQSLVIAEAIRKVGKRIDLYDVLVLTRGGGSLEDLAVFNEEIVARALKESLVPTVSAIGHEQDVTICDFVADERVATPTAAAIRLSGAFKESLNKIESLFKRLLTLLRWRWENVNLGFDNILAKLNAKRPTFFLQNLQAALNTAENELFSSFKLYAVKRKERFEKIYSRLAANMPLHKLKREEHKVELLENRTFNSAKKAYTDYSHKLELLEQRLKLLDPEKLLQKGYALVTAKDGTPVSSAKEVKLEEELEIKMKDGYINTFVTGKKLV